MTITSFWFLLLVLSGVVIYYLAPKKIRWVVLLLLSIVFYYFAATPYTIIYLVISTVTAYAATVFADVRKKRTGSGSKGITIVAVIAIIVNTALWFVLKGSGLWAPITDRLFAGSGLSNATAGLIASLGMGYYTLQIIGYIIDCYWENIELQKNPLKLFLFVSFFPQLTTGPISRYENLKTLYDEHVFSYKNITFGSQRILWGFVKKLVLAERVGIIVSGINAAPDAYNGFYSWIVVLLYPLQMYADFSGCMDIVIGVAELFDIRLAENFNNPFFSRTSQEFWQRWHITLGTWSKDYILYPILKSGNMVRFSKWSKGRFGKKASRFLTNAIGMFFLWMIMGIWHGGYRYIVGVSLWYWVIMMTGDLLSPAFKKLTEILKVRTESFSWHLFQSIRTYIIYAIGAVFFSAGISGGFAILMDSLKVLMQKGYANPWIFFDGSILELGVTHGDINTIILCAALLLIVGILRERHGYARNWVAEQGIAFRWIIWISLFIFVLILGKYGPGYDASVFIYQGF